MIPLMECRGKNAKFVWYIFLLAIVIVMFSPRKKKRKENLKHDFILDKSTRPKASMQVFVSLDKYCPCGVK